MSYDASRPVPWIKLLRLFVVYAVIANLVFFVFFRSDYGWGAVIGTVAGGAVYLAVSSVLVKFGWDPPMLRARANAREAGQKASAAPATGSSSGKPAAPSRSAPAPTKRTNAGNRKAKKR